MHGFALAAVDADAMQENDAAEDVDEEERVGEDASVNVSSKGGPDAHAAWICPVHH